MRSLFFFILLMAFAAPLLAENDSTAQRTHYIIFKSKGSSPAFIDEAAEQKAGPSSAATVNSPAEKRLAAPADTAGKFILKHEYETALPDTLIDDDEPVKKKPAKKEPKYLTAIKILLLAAMAVLALNAVLSLAGGVGILVIGIVLLATQGSTIAAVIYTIVGAVSVLAGGLTFFGLYKLMKIPFFDSVLRRNSSKKQKEEKKPQIFN